MFSRETSGPGIHADPTWHAPPIRQTPGNVPLRSLMSVLFWPHKGNQHNVKQVVLMTCRNLPEISLFSTSATQHVLRLLFHPNESVAPWETAISLKGTNNLALQKTSRYLYAKPWRRVWATAAVKGKTVKFQFAGSAACSSGFSFLFWDELLTGHEGEGGKSYFLAVMFLYLIEMTQYCVLMGPL